MDVRAGGGVSTVGLRQHCELLLYSLKSGPSVFELMAFGACAHDSRLIENLSLSPYQLAHATGDGAHWNVYDSWEP